jgi:hypothetical protein
LEQPLQWLGRLKVRIIRAHKNNLINYYFFNIYYKNKLTVGGKIIIIAKYLIHPLRLSPGLFILFSIVTVTLIRFLIGCCFLSPPTQQLFYPSNWKAFSMLWLIYPSLPLIGFNQPPTTLTLLYPLYVP